MYSCILCPLAPWQLTGCICKLVAAEDDWSVNRWNLMLIKMNAFNVAWQWFAWIFKSSEDLLLGILWLRLYLLQKAIQMERPCGFWGLALLLSVGITSTFSVSNIILRKLWKWEMQWYLKTKHCSQIHGVHRNSCLWRSAQILFFRKSQVLVDNFSLLGFHWRIQRTKKIWWVIKISTDLPLWGCKHKMKSWPLQRGLACFLWAPC